MGRSPATLPAKRGRPNSTPSHMLPDVERILYELIKSKEGMGIWMGDLKRESKLQDNVVGKSVKSLESKNLIKPVTNVHNKGRKHYMAVEFEPSKEVSGGSWYTDGKLDMELIEVLRVQCLNHVKRMKFATIEGISESIRKSHLFKIEISTQQITEIVQALVLDNVIEEVRSTGKGDFSSMPLGKVCYQLFSRECSETYTTTSFPCEVCPQLRECTPGGIISPTTCVYFKKWLDF
ncbi:uncharacterized protein LOC143890015 [Tasmannia lanceolata]|uniref:uncharacterized protein LOC143890015 n=1 Tax=Tasmannia lanceolata TaxID=3420 RepID=UPI0040632CED